MPARTRTARGAVHVTELTVSSKASAQVGRFSALTGCATGKAVVSARSARVEQNPDVWVPKTYASRRYSWITPPGAVVALDAETIQAGGVLWQRAQGPTGHDLCSYWAC